MSKKIKLVDLKISSFKTHDEQIIGGAKTGVSVCFQQPGSCTWYCPSSPQYC